MSKYLIPKNKLTTTKSKSSTVTANTAKTLTTKKTLTPTAKTLVAKTPAVKTPAVKTAAVKPTTKTLVASIPTSKQSNTNTKNINNSNNKNIANSNTLIRTKRILTSANNATAQTKATTDNNSGICHNRNICCDSSSCYSINNTNPNTNTNTDMNTNTNTNTDVTPSGNINASSTPNSSSNGYANYNNNGLLQQGLRPRKRVIGEPIQQYSVAQPTISDVIPAAEQPQPQPQPPPQKSLSDMIDNNSQLINDCMNIIIQCDPNQSCSKDEIIARIAYQKSIQLKKSGGVRTQLVIAMEKILSDLMASRINDGIAQQTVTRREQDKLVRSNPLEENIYKMKIDLTLPEDKRHKGDDPTSVLFKEGKTFWTIEGQKRHVVPKDKEENFKKERGNKPLPKELARHLVGYA
jgi:hypothetical protein